MTVYVDDAGIPATVANGSISHTSRWSHLTADTQDELHEFAAALGLRRSYFQPGQNRGDGAASAFWHYDVTEGKRKQAIRLGAREVSWREMPDVCLNRPAPEGIPATPRIMDELICAAGKNGNVDQAQGYINLARMAFPDEEAWWAKRERDVNAIVGQREAGR
jgi:Protein of unknown function (DUF4031)